MRKLNPVTGNEIKAETEINVMLSISCQRVHYF